MGQTLLLVFHLLIWTCDLEMGHEGFVCFASVSCGRVRQCLTVAFSSDSTDCGTVRELARVVKSDPLSLGDMGLSSFGFVRARCLFCLP